MRSHLTYANVMATLDIGDAARAYAAVNPVFCTGTPGTCDPSQSKGVSSVTREQTGIYCVTAPGIDPNITSAVVSVEWNGTAFPEGNASVLTDDSADCGNGSFVVRAFRLPVASGTSEPADNVGFTIVIP